MVILEELKEILGNEEKVINFETVKVDDTFLRPSKIKFLSDVSYLNSRYYDFSWDYSNEALRITVDDINYHLLELNVVERFRVITEYQYEDRNFLFFHWRKKVGQTTNEDACKKLLEKIKTDIEEKNKHIKIDIKKWFSNKDNALYYGFKVKTYLISKQQVGSYKTELQEVSIFDLKSLKRENKKKQLKEKQQLIDKKLENFLAWL